MFGKREKVEGVRRREGNGELVTEMDTRFKFSGDMNKEKIFKPK